jgi:hypothetical protein
MKRVVLDIEASNLIQNALDYTKLPYRLKDDFNVWCVVCNDIDTKEVKTFVGEAQIKNELPSYLESVSEVIGHNLISYDLPVLKLWAGIDFTVGYLGEPDTICNKPVKIWDTLVLSKLLYSATIMEHSLGAWGKKFGNEKIDFHDFSKYSEDMLTYCIQDTAVNSQLFFKLMEEYNSYSWSQAYEVEKKLMEITFRQSEYGFKFNKELAEDCVKELTQLMDEIAEQVNPLLPPKKLNKGDLKQYIPPKIQFKKCGSVSAVMQKWVEKHGGKLEGRQAELYGKVYELPIDQVPIITDGIASIDDMEHIKWHLMQLGWNPTQNKERDLTVDAKKRKRTAEEYRDTVERYVKQCEEGLFGEFRCDILETPLSNLKTMLLSKDTKKPVRVPTSPSLTVGVEKEICPNLIAMADKFPFAKQVVNYYTYKHRKNSIAGGVDEDGEPTSGFLSQPRVAIDGRIPTPCDTNGAATSRYLHKIVCNIPRVTSLYGENMRALFGVDRAAKQVQLGFDFSSLEALCQASFCLPYTKGKELAESLLAEKPNDVHSVTGRKMGVDRNTAKSLNYMSMYGAQPPKIAKALSLPLPRAQKLFNDYWEAVPALAELKKKIEDHWEKNGKKFIRGMDGRKLYSRSKHSLVNLAFQNAGALASKYTIVYIDKILKDRRLLGNPFEFDCHRVPSVMQMIVNHDEGQFSVHQSLVSFKIFATEDEAKGAQTPDSSAVCHVNDKYFLAYSPVAGIIREAIDEATKILNFKVPLGFEWQVGDNWASCH